MKREAVRDRRRGVHFNGTPTVTTAVDERRSDRTCGETPAAPTRSRLESIDFLRGAVMILMALDHVRHFFSNSLSFRATDFSQTTAPLFLTRWVTHFCAPVFVLLAGAGAFFSAAAGKSKAQLSRLLVTRGLWLVLLELTFVRFGWTLNLDYGYVLGGVLWALGWSMVALAGMVWLPRTLITGIGVAMIALHNLLDPIRPSRLGSWGWFWKILHVPGQFEPISGVHFKVAYPLVPWIGVMAAGYGFGALLQQPPDKRNRQLFWLGGALTLAFFALRATNLYGDTHPWSVQKDGLFTFLSFLNCDKYPPSLLFLLMTLGPAICALGLSGRLPAVLIHPVVVFGRVPLFFYLIHIPLIHVLAVLFAYARYGEAGWLFRNPPSGHLPFPLPQGYGYGLVVVYALWVGVVVVLFPLCRWFAGVKRRHRSIWLSYL